VPASQEQKVDFLLKKIGYSASKTGIAEDESAIGINTNTAKTPFEEGIPSPLIIPSTNILSDSSFIPTTPPGSDTAYVKVYPTSSALRMTRDSTVGTSTRSYIAYTTYNDTSSARLTNWIDTQFGASYIIKVFKDDPTVATNELQQAGGGNGTDGWFFDYSSGVLNFNGNALPSGISATNIYIVGYRYIGATGVQPPAGIGTFHDLVVSNNLSVGGISTLSKEVGIGSALNVSGITTFKDDVEFHGASGITSAFFDKSDNSFKFIDNVKAKFGTNNNLEIYHNPVNSYIANNSNNLYITNTDGEIFIQAKAGEDSIICHDDGAVQLYHDNVLKCQTRDFGFSIFQDLNISNNLDVSGVSTFTGTIDANGIIEATAGQNKIPSLYQNFSDLPNAGTYHGMFAHVHALGRGYFAHGGAWYELVNKESNGVVGTGTEKYNLGFTDTVNLKVTGITTLGSIGISTGIISGPAVTYIDPAAVGDNTGTVVIKGDLQIDGTQTTVNSSTMTVSDKNIEMAVGAANDAAADGGGITVKSGDGDKTWRWLDGTDSWTSSEHIRIAAGKVFGFDDDPNTYIHRPAADTIAFTNGGSERLRITSSQTRIGSQAATDTTSYEIQLSGAANNDAILSLYNPTTNNGEGIQQGFFFKNSNNTVTEFARIESTAIETTAATAKGDLRFHTRSGSAGLSNASERLRITSAGNVGIGTTNIEAPFQVAGENSQGLVALFGHHDFIDDSRYNYRDATIGLLGQKVTGVSTGAGVQYTTRNLEATNWHHGYTTFDQLGHFHIGLGGFGTTSATDKITILSNGAVGLGTTNPSVRFEVLGDSNLKGNLNVTGVSTFTGAIDANGNLDVDGQTDLDDLSVAGVSTFSGEIKVTAGNSLILNSNTSAPVIKIQGDGPNFIRFASDAAGTVDADSIDIVYRASPNTLVLERSSDATGLLSIDADDGQVVVSNNLNVTGNADVDGQTDLDDLAVSGISTFTGNINANGNIVGDNSTAITGIANVTGQNVNSLKLLNVGYVGNTTTIFNTSFLHFSDQNVPAFGSGGNFTTLASVSGLNLIFDSNNNDNNGLVIGSGSTNTSLMTTHMVVSHVGKVGIGSAIPQATLDVNGRSELDNVNIAETLNVVGVSTFSDDVTFTTANGNNVVLDKSTNGLDFGDNVSLRFGASNDLAIYHDQSVSRILDTYGHLLLNSNIIELKSNTGNKSYFLAGNQSPTKLFYDGNEKFATSGVGVTVTGLTDTDTLTTGNATFTGTISAGSTTGTDGYYLQSVGTGVTWAQFPTMRTNQTFTATADQTTFSFNYNVGFVDVFVNGVKLPTSEFTASNGSSVILDDGCFVNDTVELISYNTVPSSGSGAQTLNQLDNVTITGVPVIGETLQHNGSAFVNDYTPSATTTSTSQTAILSLAIATYRSVEYTVQITEGTKYHVTKILAIHDGTNVSFNEYGTLFTTSSLATFALDVNSGSMRLLATPASTNSTVFKVKFNAIKV